MAPRKISPKQAKIGYLRERDGGKCIHCGQAMIFGGPVNAARSATIEHIIPKARGGPNWTFNCALAHFECNQRRGIAPMEQETAVPIPSQGVFTCHTCLDEQPDYEALQYHRLKAHGMLSTHWMAREPRWPTDVAVPLRQLAA